MIDMYKVSTVNIIFRSMGFMLNLIFFICVPCIMVWDIYKQMIKSFNKLDNNNHKKPNKDGSKTKNYFSSHDIKENFLNDIQV